MLGVRVTLQEDSDFLPAEAVIGTQLVLPGQFIDKAESPSFLKDLQTAMAGRSPPPTRHNSTPGPTSLPGAPTGPLHPGPSGRGAAAASACLRQSLSRAGAVNPFLSSADRRENRPGLPSLPQAGQDADRHRTCTAAAQGTPRCAGATCPHAAAVPAGFPAITSLDL
jgi:hypothetical protein